MDLEKEFFDEWDRIAKVRSIRKDSYNVPHHILKDQNKEFYLIVDHNRRKMERPAPDKKDILLSCGLDKEIVAWNNGEQNMIFGNRYDPYFLTPNHFPNIRGHALAIHKEHTGYSYRPDKQDLDVFIQMSNETGCTVSVNIEGSGATLPTHKHAHISPIRLPLQELKRKKIEPGLEEVVEYPFSNLVFTGEKSAENAGKFLNVYNSIGLYGLLIKDFDIHFVPLKKFWTKGFSIYEASGYFIVGDEDDFEKPYEHFFDIIESTIPSREDLNLLHIYESVKNI